MSNVTRAVNVPTYIKPLMIKYRGMAAEPVELLVQKNRERRKRRKKGLRRNTVLLSMPRVRRNRRD